MSRDHRQFVETAVRMTRVASVAIAVSALASPASAQRVTPELSPRTLTPAQIGFLFGEPEDRTRPITTLQGWDGVITPDYPQANTYGPGPIVVDWNRKNLTWWFSASTTAPAMVNYEWQVAAYGFPPGTWTPIPGLDGKGTATGMEFMIDLDPFAPRPLGWHPKFFAGNGKATHSSKPIFFSPIPAAQRNKVSTLSKFAGVFIPPSANASMNAFIAQGPPAVGQPMTLFARVVPLGLDGTPVGPPSNVVRFDFGEPAPTKPIELPNLSPPALHYAAYDPVRWFTFDYRCHVIASQDWIDPITGAILIPKGQPANMCDDDDSILDNIVETFGSFVEFLGDFVDWVSETYSNVKGELISFAASNIPGCDATCELAIEIGVNAGLAAVGMPPDLPNVDQLQAMGEGYLVDTIVTAAEQQTGASVPDVVKDELKEAVHDMIEEAKDLADGGDGSSFWVPNRLKQFRAPIITVDLTNNGNKLTLPTTLVLQDLDGDRYHPASFLVPSLKPGQTLRIALTLTPKDDPEGWMALLPTSGDGIASFVLKYEQAEAALNAWAAKYRAGDLRVGSSFQSSFSISAGPSLTCTADPTVPGTCAVH
jgi:hypothetical protein